MKMSLRSTYLIGLALILAAQPCIPGGYFASAASTASITLQAPVLKWSLGGCYNSWCESGWYSSPAVADLDQDGKADVVGATYTMVILDGVTGDLKRRVYPPGGREWPGVVVADLQKDGRPEIVTAHGDGYVNVFNGNGDLLWSRQPTPGNELRSLAAYDLDGNGDLEVIVASTRNYNQWWVYRFDGSLYPGSWPQHDPDSNTNGYTAGCYNENVGAADLDQDGRGEIIGPNDTHYLAAFQDNGAQMRASSIYGMNQDGTNKVWSRVGVHVDHSVDIRGYANCGSEHRPNFANTAPTLVDVNQDGTLEVIVVGNIYNCGTSPYTDLYEMPFILNADRTRWKSSPYDWTAIPTPDSLAGPLSEDWNLIETAEPNPAVADLDGDGNLEILYASYDGRLHAYWLDKSEHGSWPYSVYNPAEGFIRFASEPVIADLNQDGRGEVIFASWTQKGSGHTGKLYILDYLGNPLQVVDLPAPVGEDWNGALAAPTLANIDGDPDLEVILNTANSGLVAYDLPGTAGACVTWGTGRGNYQRSGSILTGSLQASQITASSHLPLPGEVITYSITLRNPGPDLGSVTVTNTLPVELIYTGNLKASSGTVVFNSGAVYWHGSVSGGLPATISYQARVNPLIAGVQTITNQAFMDNMLGTIIERKTMVVVNGYGLYLPILKR